MWSQNCGVEAVLTKLCVAKSNWLYAVPRTPVPSYTTGVNPKSEVFSPSRDALGGAFPTAPNSSVWDVKNLAIHRRPQGT
jgi:hypothetical protein